MLMGDEPTKGSDDIDNEGSLFSKKKNFKNFKKITETLAF